MSSFGVRCPWCGAGNRPQMTWCIECGEPLDAGAGPLQQAPAQVTAGGGRPLARLGQREWVLGLGLLLAVLLVGGVDWWQQEHGGAAYHRGAAAVTARHWADAAAAFGEAGGYRDAPARAAAARATLQTITQLYDAARAATRRRDWAMAARSYSGVAALQPDFRDVATQLPPVRTALLQQQAAGTIYGTMGAGAGLYRLGLPGQADWRLPGSDGASRVRLYAGAGRRVVYDGAVAGRPVPGVSAAPTRRVLWLADLADPQRPQVTRLPEALPPDGTARPAPDGFWWFSGGMPGAGVVYYDYRAGTITPVMLTPGWSLAASDAAHGWLILAYSATGGDGAARTWLYLSNADGVIFAPVTAVDGRVQDAQVSPDGRAVLFTNVLPATHRPYTGLDLLLVRLDVPISSPPSARRVLTLDTLKLPEDVLADEIRLTARFLPGGNPTRILTDHTDQYGRRQALYDSGTGLQLTIWGDLPPPRTVATFDLSAGGADVLTQHPERAATRLVVQSAAELAKAGDLRVPSTPDSLVVARLAGGDRYVLIAVSAPHPSRSRQVYTLYSAALGGSGKGQPVPLYTGVYDPTVVPTPLLTAAPGGDALLYLTPSGALQVTTLDGQVSGPLALGVRRLWVP